MFYGEWPEHKIDRINRVRSDNRPENLRAATHTQNGYNSKLRLDNASGFRGVSFDKSRSKWRATLTVDKKHRTLGRFHSKELAIETCRAAALAVFGEFAPDHIVRNVNDKHATR